MTTEPATAELQSAYYVGEVEHRRRTARPHDFGYRVAWIYLDLSNAAGGLDIRADIPNDPTLVGMSFYQQWVPVELGAQGQIVEITASNALRLEIGRF